MPRRIWTVLSLLGCFLQGACTPTTGGQGIGPPSFTARTRPPHLGLRIVQVYPGDPNLGINPAAVNPANPNAFVQLANEGSATVVFSQTPLLLLSQRAKVDLSTLPPLAPQARTTVDATNLQLHWAADEVAVLDSAFNGQAYLAWGNEPALLGEHSLSQLEGLNADTQGAVAVPMINTRNLAIINDPNAADPNLRVTGCAAPDPNRLAGAAAPAPCPTNGTTPLARITEVAPKLGSNMGWLELLNESGGPVNLYGSLLCYGDACRMLDEDVVILTSASAEDANHLARAVVYVHASSGTHTTAGVIDASNLPELPGAGEIALLPPGAVQDGNLVVAPWSYLRYGATAPNRYAEAAIGASLWSDPNQWVPTPRLLGDSISVNPNTPPSFGEWQLAAATPGAPNTTIDLGNPATWTACSLPPPGANVTIAVQVVDFGKNVVTLRNLSGAAVDLTGYQLANPVGAVALPAGALQPDAAALRVELGPSGCTSNPNVCWQDGNATLNYNEISVLDAGGQVVHHVQWEQLANTTPAANPFSSRGAAAQTARVWPAPRCRIGPVSATYTLQLGDPPATGHSPTDYIIVDPAAVAAPTP